MSLREVIAAVRVPHAGSHVSSRHWHRRARWAGGVQTGDAHVEGRDAEARHVRRRHLATQDARTHAAKAPAVDFLPGFRWV